MNKEVILELARRWEEDAKPPLNGSLPQQDDVSERILMAKEVGARETKRECADTLRTLVGMLG